MFRTTQLHGGKKVQINYGEYNTFGYRVKDNMISFLINGEVADEMPVPSFPRNAFSVESSDDKVFVKLVNIAEDGEDIAISLDCDVESAYTAHVVAGDSHAQNSLDNPENVCDKLVELTGAGKEFVYHAPASSMNVLVLTKK